LVIAEIIRPALPGCVQVGEVTEIELMADQVAFQYGGFTCCVHAGKAGLVFFQDPVYPPDCIVCVTQLFVVIGIPALIAAKFLIGAPMKGITTFKACSFRHKSGLFTVLYALIFFQPRQADAGFT
jgi:hypothetical protein